MNSRWEQKRVSAEGGRERVAPRGGGQSCKGGHFHLTRGPRVTKKGSRAPSPKKGGHRQSRRSQGREEIHTLREEIDCPLRGNSGEERGKAPVEGA